MAYDTATILVSAVLILIALLALLQFVWFLRVNVFNPQGKGAWKRTTRTLRRFALLRQFQVLDHVGLRDEEGAMEIENMLIGYFGILIVTTLGARGTYYGMPDSQEWSVVLGDKKQVFPNPIKQQKRQIAALRTLFTNHNIYKVPIERVIYFTNRSGKTEINVTDDGSMMLPGKLSGYLDRSWFEKDAGIDVKKLAALASEGAR